MGMKRTDEIRADAVRIALTSGLTRKQRSCDTALVSELNRIGVNVNQLARVSHRGSDFTRY